MGQSRIAREPMVRPRRLKSVKKFVVVAVVSMFGAACTADTAATTTNAEPSPAVQPGDGPLPLIRVHSDDPGFGMDAIVQGVVEVDAGAGCVWLSTPDGARNPVVWPLGTEERHDPYVIVLPDGAEVMHGDHVSGGGGYLTAAAATTGMAPFPGVCLQDGDAAVFNANSAIEVTRGVGVEAADTLFGRFAVPESIGLELIAVNPNRRSVAVADFVSGTVHVFEPSDYESPGDAIDGASGGGGFIHLWSQGTVFSYPGRLDQEPLIYVPEPLRQIEGVAPILEVVPAPDGERTWLVQDGAGFGPTLIELVNLVEVEVARILATEVEGSWQPVGSTVDGLVLVANDGLPRTLLVRFDGAQSREIAGEAMSVGWNGALILQDSELLVSTSDLGGLTPVEKPVIGSWGPVGGPLIPTDSPPIRSAGTVYLAGLFESGSPGQLVVVQQDGSSRVIHQLDSEGAATFSRADDWVAVFGSSGVTLIPGRGDPVTIGVIFPSEHWVLTAG